MVYLVVAGEGRGMGHGGSFIDRIPRAGEGPALSSPPPFATRERRAGASRGFPAMREQGGLFWVGSAAVSQSFYLDECRSVPFFFYSKPSSITDEMASGSETEHTDQ